MGAINKLTASKLPKLGPGRHGDGGGLYLDVDRYGRRWVFRYRWRAPGEAGEGKRREMGLGPLRDVSLAQARVMAGKARELLRMRRDPVEARSRGEALDKPSFGSVADEYMAAMAPQFRNAKHIWQWRQTLGDAYCRSLRARPIDEIETADVLAVLQPIWLAKMETAARLRGRIERVLDAAKARGLRSGENPARWRGHLDHLLPRRQKLQRGHHRALPVGEMAEFVARLRERQTTAAWCLEFVILTACRTGEAIGARWEEIDGDVWTIPAERMKAKRAHRVPLSRRAVSILEVMRQHGSEWVFPGQHLRRHLSNMAMLVMLRDMGSSVTVHGFRSTFRDWAGDHTSFPREIIETALAHAVGSATEAAYRRGDALERRRDLMEAWAGYCEPEQASNVVRLRG
jgi:integrase